MKSECESRKNGMGKWEGLDCGHWTGKAEGKIWNSESEM